MSKSKSRGFTLIELLVVIAIVAILAAMLFPVFAKAKERGNQATCMSNLKQLCTAVSNYRNDFSGRLPSAGAWTGLNPPDWCGSNGTGVAIYPEKGSLFPYVRSAKVYKCGSDRTKPAQYARNSSNDWPLSYSMNFELFDINLDSGFTKRLSKCMLFVHEARETINDGLYRPATDDVSNAHYDGTTVAYADGHACWKSQKMLRQEESELHWTWRNGYR